MNNVAQHGLSGSGPYAGQSMKQGQAVEYASAFSYPDQIAD